MTRQWNANLREEADILNQFQREDEALVAKWEDALGTFGYQVAQTVKSSGHMTDRQRRVLRKPIPTLGGGHRFLDGDPQEDDWEITNYELCAGEWGD